LSHCHFAHPATTTQLQHHQQRQRHFPRVPITALTATATAKVRDDILALLGIRSARIFKV
jgi:superfamily II DNA helicase RecQ